MTIKKVTSGLLSIALFCGISVIGSFAIASADMVEEGKKVAFDRKKGNCMTCHVMPGARLAGNIGPPLVAMKAKPDIKPYELRTGMARIAVGGKLALATTYSPRMVFALDRMEGARQNTEAAGYQFDALLTKEDLGI